MTRVKICGITNLADAKTAVAGGADALGFIFAKSPRRVSVAQAKRITKALGPWVSTVGVFVNAKAPAIKRIARECALSAIQLHGDETPALAKALRPYRVIKAFRVDESLDLTVAGRYPADTLLFDTGKTHLYGGTGRRFDWKRLPARRLKKPFIISGGLGPGNVRAAVRHFKPYGVDVSSGVERSPGKKNPQLVRKFIQNAKKR